MANDLDRDLMRAFAEASTPLAADDFLRRLKPQIAWRRRTQAAPRLLVVVALFLAGALWAHALVSGSVFALERIGELLISPVGWTLSLLLAVAVVRRQRLFRH